MKRILIAISLLLSITGFSQSFSVAELVKISKYSADDFDTYVTKKGYVFYEETDEEIASGTSYTFLLNGAKRFYITKYNPKKRNYYWVDFQTSNSNTYLKIKEELKNSGYLQIDKGTINGSTYFKYRKQGKEVNLFSGSETNEYTKQTRVSYEIGVSVYY